MSATDGTQNRTYKLINLLLLSAVAFLSVIILAVHFSGGKSCWLRVVYGKDCFVCGCTRDLVGVFTGREGWINSYSPYFFGLIACDILWRIVASVWTFGKKVWLLDAAIHAGLICWILIMNFKYIFSAF